MAIHYWLRDATGTVVEVAGRIRALTEDDSVNAEEGSVGMFRVEIDDPDGTYRVGGHRLFYVTEDTADPMDQILALGYTQERVISRGDLVEGYGTSGRVIAVDVADANTILSRRVMTGSDANRPAETDVARVRWLVMTNEASLIVDSRYLDDSGPKNMDAADYRGQMLMNVLEDCAEASDKNYGVTWFQTGSDPHTQTAVSFFYLFSGDDIWDSTARLTNVGAEVDDATTFVVATADLTQSPMRVFSGIYANGDGITDYDQLLSTATAFARRDTIMSFPNVKSAAKLQTRITRMLASLATEEYRVAITFFMRPADVNRVRPGMRVQVKFSHLPELGSGYVWVRMLTRQVTMGEDTGFAFYRVSGVFSAEVPSLCAGGTYAETAAGTYGALNSPGTTNNVIYYCSAGGFYPEVPTPSHQRGWAFMSWGSGGTPDYGQTPYWPAGSQQVRLIVVGDGSLTFTMVSTGGAQSFDWALVHGLSPGSTIDSSGTGSAGTPVVVPVSSHGGTQCVHRVVVSMTGTATSANFGFSTSTWTPS